MPATSLAAKVKNAVLESVAALAPGYGTGCYRRAIRLSAVGPRRVEAVLEDDPHAFALHIDHDGERVTAVCAHAERFPLTTCPGATQPIEALVGAVLSTVTLELKRHADPRSNCTHLFDLAALAIAHAARGAGGERRYDIEIPDARDGHTEARLYRDGEIVLRWSIEHGRITAPDVFAGQQVLGGFTRWASATLAGEELEHALMLARGYFVALARLYGMDVAGAGRAIDHAMPSGACHSYSPGVVEDAWRVVGSRRDFSASPEGLLRWTDSAWPQLREGS
jgi:hypothetical protein